LTQDFSCKNKAERPLKYLIDVKQKFSPQWHYVCILITSRDISQGRTRRKKTRFVTIIQQLLH